MVDGLAPRFRALFNGLDRAHGTYNNIDNTREDGKRQGKAVTKREPVTDELWAGHLAGKNGIGIIPIRDDSTVVFGAVDIDVYADLDPAQIAHQIDQLKLPLVPCRSKSGGVHIYLFTSVPVPASVMVERLQDIAATLGHGKAEIFPKQTVVIENSPDIGSWINMPYFDGVNTTRYAVKGNGDAFSPEDFLAYADSRKAGLDFFEGSSKGKAGKPEKTEGEKLLPDAPPCLQHLLDLGFPEGTRNGALFNLGVYYRKARPDFVACIEAANQKFFTVPLPMDEVKTICDSLGRKDFLYGCNTHPLMPYCNAVKCRTRKYGVGGGASSFPVLGQMRKLLTVPPVWFLDVQDPETGDYKVLELSADDLQDPRAFQKQCITRLDIMPVMPSAIVWQQTVTALLKAQFRMEAPPEESASAEGQFWEWLEVFCTDRAQAQTMDEILMGKPYTDPAKKRTYFRTSDLLAFLGRKHFSDYKVQQLAKVLKMRKDPADKGKPTEKQRPFCTHEFVKIAGKGVNLWSVPEYPKRIDPYDLPETLMDNDKSF